jgi:hypothetical protein
MAAGMVMRLARPRLVAFHPRVEGAPRPARSATMLAISMPTERSFEIVACQARSLEVEQVRVDRAVDVEQEVETESPRKSWSTLKRWRLVPQTS